jgi:hypothetical protein
VGTQFAYCMRATSSVGRASRNAREPYHAGKQRARFSEEEHMRVRRRARRGRRWCAHADVDERLGRAYLGDPAPKQDLHAYSCACACVHACACKRACACVRARTRADHLERRATQRCVRMQRRAPLAALRAWRHLHANGRKSHGQQRATEDDRTTGARARERRRAARPTKRAPSFAAIRDCMRRGCAARCANGTALPRAAHVGIRIGRGRRQRLVRERLRPP